MRVLASGSGCLAILGTMAVVLAVPSADRSIRADVAARAPASTAAGLVTLELEGLIGDAARAVDIEGRYAYVSNDDSLVILDILDARAPRALSSILVPCSERMAASARNAWFRNRSLDSATDYVYIGAGACGLHVVDVSTPTAPRELSSRRLAGDAEGVRVSGDYAYVAAGDAGLRILDVTAPAALRETGFVDTPGFAAAVDVVAGYAYAADGEGGMRVIDVSDPSSPVEVASVGLSVRDHTAEAVAIRVANGHAYLGTTSASLFVIDVSTPESPRQVALHEYGEHGDPLAIDVVGTYAYVVHVNSPTPSYTGVSILDVSEPSSPTYVGDLQTPPGSSAIRVADGIAYVAAGVAGLRVVDVAQPHDPREIAVVDELEGGGGITALEVVGAHAYLGTSDGAFHVVSVASSVAPQAVGIARPARERSWPEIDERRDLHVVNGYAYVTNHSPSNDQHYLQVLDVSTPTSPRQVGVFDSSERGNPSAVRVADGLAFVAQSSPAGLRVLDVTAPRSPQSIAFADLGSHYPWDLDVADGHAYVAGESGLRVFDVTAPSAVHEAGFVRTTSAARAVRVAAQHAFFTTDTGVHVIDVSVPGAPREVGFFSLANAYQVEYAGGRLFVTGGRPYGATSYDPLPGCVLDLATPAAPRAVGSCDGLISESLLDVVGGYVYVTSGSRMSVLRIIEHLKPVQISLPYIAHS